MGFSWECCRIGLAHQACRHVSAAQGGAGGLVGACTGSGPPLRLVWWSVQLCGMRAVSEDAPAGSVLWLRSRVCLLLHGPTCVVCTGVCLACCPLFVIRDPRHGCGSGVFVGWVLPIRVFPTVVWWYHQGMRRLLVIGGFCCLRAVVAWCCRVPRCSGVAGGGRGWVNCGRGPWLGLRGSGSARRGKTAGWVNSCPPSWSWCGSLLVGSLLVVVSGGSL